MEQSLFYRVSKRAGEKTVASIGKTAIAAYKAPSIFKQKANSSLPQTHEIIFYFNDKKKHFFYGQKAFVEEYLKNDRRQTSTKDLIASHSVNADSYLKNEAFMKLIAESKPEKTKYDPVQAEIEINNARLFYEQDKLDKKRNVEKMAKEKGKKATSPTQRKKQEKTLHSKLETATAENKFLDISSLKETGKGILVIDELKSDHTRLDTKKKGVFHNVVCQSEEGLFKAKSELFKTMYAEEEQTSDDTESA